VSSGRASQAMVGACDPLIGEPSNSPLSLSFILGIASKAMKDKVIKGACNGERKDLAVLSYVICLRYRRDQPFQDIEAL
jgi:hypothetical protein